MKIRNIATALVLGLALSPATTAGVASKTITVFGTDSPGDAAAIQAALDSVVKNGTVELVGTFFLDGTELFVRNSHVTIRGRAIDNDGDGKVNEDWDDGNDNDHDGLIDEDGWDATLRGILRTDGSNRPARGEPRQFFNRGIAVIGLENVHIMDLKFTATQRGVTFGGFTYGDGQWCRDQQIVGPVRNSSAERNLFNNTIRGAQAFGESHNVRFRDNLHINGAGASFLLVEDAVGCFDDDNNRVEFAIGRPSNALIERNRIYDNLGSAIYIFAAERTTVTNNEAEGARFGVNLTASPNTLVQQNRFAYTEFEGVVVFTPDADSGHRGDSIGTRFRTTSSPTPDGGRSRWTNLSTV